MSIQQSQSWNSEQASLLYGVKNWSNDFFEISDKGEVMVRLKGNGAYAKPFSLMKIISGLQERGVTLPVLLRFGELLTSRIEELNVSFQKAIDESAYKGVYRGVYPIKVNQQQQAIEEITKFGRRFHYGLEAGTKAELIAALAYMHDPEAYLICNGYKDEEFIDLALRATKMGLRVIMVLEMPSEIKVILQRAKELEVDPMIGIRVRLAAQGCGHWSESAGDKSVFGLNASQLISTVDELKASGMLHCLKMLHYHQGSQVPNIRAIREGALEACRVYVDLVKEGAPMGLLDLGGGLAVDYDGSQSSSTSSSNYGIEEYCVDLVEIVKSVTDEAGVPNPDLISESGRAVVAYYSVLVFDILDVNRFAPDGELEALPEGVPSALRDLYGVAEMLEEENAQECYNDAIFYRDQLRQMFVHGSATLRDRGLGENAFWHTVTRIAELVEEMDHVPEDLSELDQLAVDFYYGNFSLFQSLPDAWAIDQVFPVMPLHRLNEYPSRRAVVADITCDCDGKLNKFIGPHDIRKFLPVHPFDPEKPYYMGVFLVGAYQETLGDLHNLIGDTNIISIDVDLNGRLHFGTEIAGDTVSDVLSYVEYNIKDLISRFRKFAEHAVAEGRITPGERREIMAAYTEGLDGYTYFEN